MRTVTGTLATACALAAALIAVGCVGSGGTDTEARGEVFLQPAADRGPDPFTPSTAATTTPPSAAARAAQAAGAPRSARALSGGTPGLYGGTAGVGSCDVDRQIAYLTSGPAKARAFARAEGVTEASVPDFLRGLAPVVLRADTRVTDHGFRHGRTTDFQSVLQAGTAVLVDDRGVPRVRCACGNPLTPAVAERGRFGTQGCSWSGFRPGQVIVVTPAPRAITSVTIIDVVDGTWIERPISHDVHHDHVIPPPVRETPATMPTPAPSPDAGEPGTGIAAPAGVPTATVAPPPTPGLTTTVFDSPTDVFDG
ncbi:DUF6777 domain-containing protein [Streptomyces gilvus]|uniref:DUF6777 domain-containing protein n=1 Tax=Streptomyces gilvus TaxID=2920937 RepID=UPI001F0D9F4E|nr:DUF6777 domain-containing protein [Streptomyces sp. CME 23]MCH5670976.1 hypothetical protein [Streptomyces sp. CME 23]